MTKLKPLLLSIIVATFAVSAKADVSYDFTHLKPSNHVQIAEKYVKIGLKDPYTAKIKVGELTLEECNIQTAGQKPWLKETMPVAKFWSAIVMVNAKNSYGAYVGNKVTRYYFDGRSIVAELEPEYDFCMTGSWGRLLPLANKAIDSAKLEKRTDTTTHTHGGRSHQHPLPAQGKAHRHGEGPIGE